MVSHTDRQNMRTKLIKVVSIKATVYIQMFVIINMPIRTETITTWKNNYINIYS